MPTAQSSQRPSNTAVAERKKLHTGFESLYNQLNDQQKLAVETTEGPVMVVAGPGTGKTQVIALRVANILRKTQMKPRNILCLTFSKSGAIAMRKRLRDIIGSDAYGVTVDTIHGFCNSIIQQYPLVFEEWSALQQITDVERYRELNKIIDQKMPHLHVVSKKNPYTRTKDILSRISQLKREGVVEVKRLQAVVGEYDKQMSQKSREGTKAHRRNILSAKKFAEFVDIFHSYQHMLQTTGRYDFEDMILRVTQAIQEEDWLRATLQERYQYVLVDEFQDTNGAQYQFIEQLTEDPTGDNQPNFFVVGDDDQAIYRFQGANLTNILSFRERFPKAPVIALTTSYRCTQPILNAAENLITQNTERLVGRIPGLEKHLTSAISQTGASPTLLMAASDMVEPWLLADVIQERLKSGIDPKEIAVLVQTNAELLHIYDVLKARNLPVELSGRIDLLQQNLVRQALCILRAIQEPANTANLSAALGADCFGCHPADLAELYQACRQESKTLLDILLNLENADLASRNREAIISARDILLSLHAQLPSRTVVETLEHVLKDTGLLRNTTEDLDVMEFAIVQEFFDRVKQRAYEQPSFSFETFLSDIDFYDNDDYGDLRLTFDLPQLQENGVQLMTAHKSKGLEFEVVLLANFREGHWDNRRNPPSLSIPEDLLFSWEKDQKAYEQQQDERRVAYVAFTRAKSELIFTCPMERTSGDSVKAVSPSGFFAEAGDLPEEIRNVQDPQAMSTLQAIVTRELDAELQTFLKRRIEHFALSPTSLHDFLEDPQVFLERHLLMVPQAKTVDFAYGNAIHHTLAHWALYLQQGRECSKTDLLQVFTDHLQQKELLPKKEQERLQALGQQAIERYFAHALQPPYPIVTKVEYDLSTHVNEVPIKGKIDRIDLLEPQSNQAVVLDYKTGKPKTPKQIEDYGYHRQLVFYALLIQHANILLEPKEFVLEFIGHEEHEPVRRSFPVSEQDKNELTALIEQVWQKIVALDFTPL